jgi:hypothetical protein
LGTAAAGGNVWRILISNKKNQVHTEKGRKDERMVMWAHVMYQKLKDFLFFLCCLCVYLCSTIPVCPDVPLLNFFKVETKMFELIVRDLFKLKKKRKIREKKKFLITNKQSVGT